MCEAYKRVKANRGAAGLDRQSVGNFEQKLKGNLYKLWNRLSPHGIDCLSPHRRRHPAQTPGLVLTAGPRSIGAGARNLPPYAYPARTGRHDVRSGNRSGIKGNRRFARGSNFGYLYSMDE